MQENIKDSIPDKTQIAPPNYNPSKKPIYLIIFLLLVSILLLGFVFLFFLKSQSNKLSQITQPTIIPNKTSPSVIPSLAISPTTQEVNSLILYIREGNIWSVKSDGTSLRQLTRDGDDNIRYSSLVFISNEEAGFIKCINTNKCSIQSKNLITSEEKKLLEKDNFLTAFTIVNNGKLIAFIGNNSQELPILYYFENGSERKILDFQPSLGRGGSLSDEISLAFSPDDKYLLVVNTITQPNLAKDMKTIWVIDRMGNTLDSIPKGSATNAVWETPTRFFYKDNEAVFRKTVGGSEENLGNIAGHGVSVSPDKKNILTWNADDSGQTIVFSYLIDSKISTEVKQNLGYSKWLDNKDIIAVKTSRSNDSYLGFVTTGLVKYDINSREEKVLDSNSSIYQFVIQR